jgi:outer membrane protein assembly factor BamB
MRGWLSWRGPEQTGRSSETGLPQAIGAGGPSELWTVRLSGRGTPVIADGRVYALGYRGEGPDLQEVLVCLNEDDGTVRWEHGWTDFLSDVIYNRYSVGSPAIDPRNGDVYALTSAGLLCAFTADGAPRWEVSMMEELGRLTFPNGRTGGPVVDGDRVIVHAITANWGPQGPARDRFYAFDAGTGALVWDCTPGEEPKDNSLSLPVLEWRGGRRVLYCATGCGNLVCIDARSGEPLWRYKMSIGGLNSSVLLRGDSVIALHGRENVDSSTIGRMVSVRADVAPAAAAPGTPGAPLLDESAERWRNDVSAFSSSPVLDGDRIYQTTETGDLCCVDAVSGRILWHHKLAPDQIHASPALGDGLLYVPMNNGSFFVIRPGDNGPAILSETQLEGNCLGAPAIANGRVYVHTTGALYCFGTRRRASAAVAPLLDEPPPGPARRLQVVPAELLLRPGQAGRVEVYALDAAGGRIGPAEGVAWTIDPKLAITIDAAGAVAVAPEARGGAGLIQAAAGELKGAARVRVVPAAPLSEDFESFTLAPRRGDGVLVAPPPPWWIGGGLKWEVRDLPGNRVLSKTLDRALFQRVMNFIGHPDESDYSMELDIMSAGTRRSMASAGVVHQRYLVVLKGNHQQLEISSNDERVKHGVAFSWSPDVWYRLKSRVTTDPDGSTLVQAKVWPREETEPGAWTVEYTHRNGHDNGAPGLFGFSPQNRHELFLDNLKITPNRSQHEKD